MSINLLATLFLIQLRMQLAFWVASTHGQLTFGLSFTNIPKPSSAGLLSIYSSHSLLLMFEIALTKRRTLCLALLNFMRFTRANLSSLSKFLWMASLPSKVPTPPHSLVSLANMLRVLSIPLTMLPTKMLNNTSPNISTTNRNTTRGSI